MTLVRRVVVSTHLRAGRTTHLMRSLEGIRSLESMRSLERILIQSLGGPLFPQLWLSLRGRGSCDFGFWWRIYCAGWIVLVDSRITSELANLTAADCMSGC